MTFISEFNGFINGNFEDLAIRGYRRHMDLKRDILSDEMRNFSTPPDQARAAIRSMDVVSRALYVAEYVFWAAQIAWGADTSCPRDEVCRIASATFAGIASPVIGRKLVTPIANRATELITEVHIVRERLVLGLTFAQYMNSNGYAS